MIKEKEITVEISVGYEKLIEILRKNKFEEKEEYNILITI